MIKNYSKHFRCTSTGAFLNNSFSQAHLSRKNKLILFRKMYLFSKTNIFCFQKCGSYA